MIRYYLFLFLFIICGLRSHSQIDHLVLDRYPLGVNNIYAKESVTLKSGFAIPLGSTSRIFISSLPELVSVPSKEKNYIRTRIFRDTVRLSMLDVGRIVGEEKQDVRYFDGLGNAVQTVQVMASPSYRDIVNFSTYDQSGRPAVDYLPYADWSGGNNGKPTGSFKTDARTAQANYYKSPNGNILQPTGWDASVVRTDFPWSVTHYEVSPLERVVEQGSPGAAWQPRMAAESVSGHTLKTKYGLNTASDSVKWWILNPPDSTELVFYVNYSKATLHKKTLMDENWIAGKSGTVEEFTNKDGALLLRRIWKTEMEPVDTYYVYDVYGDLTYVLPPGIQNQPISLSGALFDQYVYAYRYDNKRRMTHKKLPGKGWEYLVYNQADQLIMTQDAVQRSKANKEWTYTKYDAFGRVAETGILTATYADQATAQAAADNHATTSLKYWEERTVVANPGSTTSYTRYTNLSFPMAGLSPRTVNYYDDHKFEGANTAGLGLTGLAYHEKNKTLLTGTVVYKDDGTAPLLTVNYYDDRARLIQSISQNHLGGTDRVTSSYNFVGELLTSTREHSVNGQTTIMVTKNEYDHVGRLLATKHTVNAQGEVILAKNEYNEIGQLKQKKLHSENGGTNYLSTADYMYNERGWTSAVSSPHFSYRLNYNVNSANVVLGNAQYNGNIAQQQWGYGTTMGSTYNYGYDKLNRLVNGSSIGTVINEAISYDNMGNIINLRRDGHATGTTYAYIGNRLKSLTGQITTAADLLYDANGNATRDRRGMTMTYNYLNLPRTATLTGTSVSYLYNAVGTKLRKIATVGSTTTQRDYVDGIEYGKIGSSPSSIEMIAIPEGYIQRNSSNLYTYHYNLTDHLGNVRATLQRTTATTGTVVQKHDYYPFGKAKAIVVSGINKYLYNGKEIQGELGDQYDYGARFYDAEIGRWNAVDPLAEQYRRWSPYNYTMNNPIRFIDPDGMSVSPIYDVNGDFLGTDENGLQGQAIVMKKENFKQGMTEEEALSYSTNVEGGNNKFHGFESKEAMLKYANHYAGLPSRPDYDGFLTLDEANDWYRNAGGKPLYVNSAQIDLSPVTVKDFDDKDSFVSNFFLTTNVHTTGRVYGSIKLTIVDRVNGRVKLGNDKGELDYYDFDIKKRDGSIKRDLRNAGTVIGGWVAGQGQPFKIYNYGYGWIGK